MPVDRVLRTRDSRWRLDFLTDGRVDLIYLGHKIMPRATMDRVGRRLAEAGISVDELVED